jgi:hypothetical protein
MLFDVELNKKLLNTVLSSYELYIKLECDIFLLEYYEEEVVLYRLN